MVCALRLHFIVISWPRRTCNLFVAQSTQCCPDGSQSHALTCANQCCTGQAGHKGKVRGVTQTLDYPWEQIRFDHLIYVTGRLRGQAFYKPTEKGYKWAFSSKSAGFFSACTRAICACSSSHTPQHHGGKAPSHQRASDPPYRTALLFRPCSAHACAEKELPVRPFGCRRRRQIIADM